MQGKTILIVDDDTVFSDILSEILREKGANVVIEHDGASGLERAKSLAPDIVVVDVMMPRMSGVEMLERFRATDVGKCVPVLLLTNMNEADTMAKRTEGDPTEVLLKTDWTLDQIAERVVATLAA